MKIIEDVLVAHLKEDILVKAEHLFMSSSKCSLNKKVENVKKIKVLEQKWEEEEDHAKWAITKKYACFGDLGRNEEE